MVYENIWREGGTNIYEEFADMMFREIMHNDRIARYYQIETELAE